MKNRWRVKSGLTISKTVIVSMTDQEIKKCKNNHSRIYQKSTLALPSASQLKFLKFILGVNLISDGSRSEESEMYFFPVLVTTVLVTA